MSSAAIKVFISYSSRYAAWVKTLHDNLELCLQHAGYSAEVFIDQDDLKPGRSWITQLEAGVDQAQHLVLVATPEAMASPRVADERHAHIAKSRDWKQGRFHLAFLVDTPLPPFLQEVQYLDFREHTDASYRRALGELVAALATTSGKPAELPPRLKIPAKPQPPIPAPFRRKLVENLAPILSRKIDRWAVTPALGLGRTALDDFPTPEEMASAALVEATGDDDAMGAALRILDTIIDAFEEEPQRVAKLPELRSELQAIRKGGPEQGLIRTWLERIDRDHSALVPYFQQRSELDMLERVYVQLELRPDLGEDLESVTERRIDIGRPLALRDLLALDSTEHPWITRRWVVRGDPGAGKTTLLRHLAGTLARQSEAPWVPLIESLPRLMREREWMLDRLERQLIRSGHPAKGLAAVLDWAGREGRLLVLLDGLDEVPREDRDDAEALLRDLSARWPEAPIVVTTRPIGYRRPASEFLELDLLSLDRERRQEFLARWFGRATGTPDIDRARQALRQLQSEASLWELSGNPLYLTLIALLMEGGSAPDRHRTRLYDQVFDLLLEGAHRDPPTPMDAQGAVRCVLRYLGHRMTDANRDAASLTELEGFLYEEDAEPICRPLERIPRWRRGLRPFLKELAECTGILGPHDGPGFDWRFWHRTFREALAAERLEEIFRGKGGAEAILEHARDIAGDESRWAEPYALLAGRVDKPDDLVRALVEENRDLGLRAVATAQGLRGETLYEILELTANWKERADVYRRIPELLKEPEPTLALLDQLRRRTRDGNDLYFIDVAVAAAADRWDNVRPRAEQLRARLYDHIPAPPEELFRRIETPQDGRVELWREIPAGSFQMGSPEAEEGRYDREGPQHEVTITAPFALAAVSVTNAQYAAFDPALPGDRQPDHPVVNVTWYAAVSFCRWLRASLPWAVAARLPTEEEWEHACRAGTTTRFWSGDSDKDLARVGWYAGNTGYNLHRVGEKPANPWGLFDMHGNILEWTASPLNNYAEREARIHLDPTAQDDHAGHPDAPGRVVRGGSYWNAAGLARSAYRDVWGPGVGDRFLGFRVTLPASAGRSCRPRATASLPLSSLRTAR